MKKYLVEMRTDIGRFGSLELLIIEADSHQEAATEARCQQPNWCVLSTEEIKE